MPPAPVKRVIAAAEVEGALAKGWPSERAAMQPARFAVGDRVRAKNINPAGHTRLPRYARGRLGTVEMVHGTHVFPDSNAARMEESPAWLYSVRFSGQELWGAEADPAVAVSIDAFEPYLDPA